MHAENASNERQAFFVNGWLALLVWCAAQGMLAMSASSTFLAFAAHPERLFSLQTGVVVALEVVLLVCLTGFTVLQPNIAAVLTFFGHYDGSFARDGFFWRNPLSALQKVSLRVYNQNTATLKVNDKAGNPVEVAAVVAWRVRDTARALFDVEDYDEFVTIQSESALRHVVSSRYYDGDSQGQESLRGDLEAVASALVETIQAHSDLAGIEIVEAKIAHLAYAPEIASAMLRRQQATAVVAARSQIVKGAVGMAQMAVYSLEKNGVVKLDEAAKVQLVTNLMTVLVSESEAQPVLPMSQATKAAN